MPHENNANVALFAENRKYYYKYTYCCNVYFLSTSLVLRTVYNCTKPDTAVCFNANKSTKCDSSVVVASLQLKVSYYKILILQNTSLQ